MASAAGSEVVHGSEVVANAPKKARMLSEMQIWGFEP